MRKNVKITAPAAVAIASALSPTISIWQPFSHIHIYSAYNLALKAAEIESSRENSKQPTQPTEELKDEHFAYVIGSIFASFAFLDAIINEVFLLTDKHAQGQNLDNIISPLALSVKQSMAQMWRSTVKKDGENDVIEVDSKNQKKEIKRHKDLINHLSLNRDKQISKDFRSNWTTLNKFQAALYLADGGLGHKPFDKKISPWTDLDLLRRLRNCLIHYRPESVSFPPYAPFEAETKEMTDLMTQLEAQKKCSNPLIPGQGVFIHLLGANCAMWTVDSSLQLVSEFAQRMPLNLNYRVHELALKRQKRRNC